MQDWTNLVTYQLPREDDTILQLTNHINGVPLYAWWVFDLLQEVEGMLTDDIRQTSMYGPFTTAHQAVEDLPFLGEGFDNVVPKD